MRVQIDITKERPQDMWLGFDEEDLSVGKWQLIQYDDILDFCSHCKNQGNTIEKCLLQKSDEDNR